MSRERERKLIGVIDQTTNRSRFLLFDEECKPVPGCQAEREVEPKVDKEGWFEQDPREILQSVEKCMEEVGRKCDLKQIKGIGITNQRETTILWDKTTGKPLYNAIGWCDVRAAGIAEELIAKKTQSKSKDDLRSLCGLPIHPYFSALKVKWLMENSEKREEVRAAIHDGRCLFGTVDSWIIWNLNGGKPDSVHVTDVTNASRTMLMNIHTLQWDPDLCNLFDIPHKKPHKILPDIKSSAEEYGLIKHGLMKDKPICGCLGDQQAALVGQHCFSPGQAKSTYGTGNFLLCNTGPQPVMSHHGMLTTVAYQLGPNKPVTYALEGAASTAGQSVQWLKGMGFFKDASEIEQFSNEVDDTAGVYFVPAFSGLFAPHWQADAVGLIIGLTNYTSKAHLCRAILEAVCFQSREILEAMNRDLASHSYRRLKQLTSIQVDGEMTNNTLFLQIQADLLGIPVFSMHCSVMTVLGAAIAAGVALEMWDPTEDLSRLRSRSHCTYTSNIGSEERDARYARWKEAVKRSIQWTGNDSTRTQALPSSGQQSLSENELVDIMGYLQDLDKSQLTNLGLVLGLSQRRLRGLMDSATFLSDMIASWLIQADQVGARSGVPTWSSLVTALRHKSVEQNGIANEIATDKHL